MPFITTRVNMPSYQYTFDDVLYGVNQKRLDILNSKNAIGNTRTLYRKNIPKQLLDEYDFPNMLELLKSFNEKHKDLIAVQDKATLYYSFKIPKKSGGLRQIDAPLDNLKFALRELKYIFESKFNALYHTTAFAYICKRSTYDALKRHQQNKSRWFLKLDFSNFFGSTTPEFVISQLEWIFPFSELFKLPDGKETIKAALSLAFLNNGLPQGTPFSPTITNIMMIPIDHHIAVEMNKFAPHIVYTRYADDLLLSATMSFKWTEVRKKIMDILSKYNAPFSIKNEKTRYGSSAGSNWNLGLMLNKDNEITIGNQRKRIFKAMLHSLHSDYSKGVFWSLSDIQEIQGLISYYKKIEGDYITKIIKHYEEKFKTETKKIIKTTLSMRHNVA